MTMAAFSHAAATWVAAGVVPLPLGGDDGKRPLVAHPDKLGRRAALDIASRPKFADAPGLGFWCGQRNGLTVVDIDSTADSEMEYAISTYGPTPVVVRTGSGKAHLYYRHDGERRRIRPDRAHPIDILGEGGLAVAPPSSRPSGGRYGFLTGGLDDIRLRRLPKIRPGAVSQLKYSDLVAPTAVASETVARGTVSIGQRNNAMFRLACALAQTAEDRDTLIGQVRAANAELPAPLPDDELQRAVSSAWRYREESRLMLAGCPSTILLPAASVERLLAAGETDVLALLTLALKAHREPGKVFAMSPAAMERARIIGSWDRKRYRNAIRRAIELGELVETYRGGRGPKDPSQYRLQKGGRFALQS